MPPAADARAKLDLSNMTVIVTGGARGMGRAMTLGLAQAGIHVVAADPASSKSEMGELSDTARLQGVQDRIIFVDCDVTRWLDCQSAVKAALDRFGAVHGLVNNAGIGMQGFGNVLVGARKRFYEHEVEAWRQAIDTNLNGPFMMAKAIAPALVAQGWGRIINVVTSHFTMVMEGFSPYGPSKAALEAATVIWSRDSGRHWGDGQRAASRRGGQHAHDPDRGGARSLHAGTAGSNDGADRVAHVPQVRWRHRTALHSQGMGSGARCQCGGGQSRCTGGLVR